MEQVLQGLAKFSSELRYEDLPGSVIRETKRMLLDSVGVSFAAHAVDKGRICTEISQRLGGAPEATIIGARGKVSASNAALANGELINALDYDALFIPGGHVAPYVVPAILAMAEAQNASGKDLILALAIGNEVAMRVTRGMSPMVLTVRDEAGNQSYRWTNPYGGSRYNLGAAAGVGRLMRLDPVKMAHALGLSGHHTQVPTHSKMSYTLPVPMSKYGTPGWQSTGAIVAALLAEAGYEGDTTLFDGKSGLWSFTGSDAWMPEKVLPGINEEWALLEQQYKPYPCCRVTHTCLDIFYALQAQHEWAPDDIEQVVIFASAYAEKPHLQNKDVQNAMDAQFSAAYAMAMAAFGVPIGVVWLEPEHYKSASVRSFMERVTCKVHPQYTQKPLADKLMILGRVEVTVGGKLYVAEESFARGTPRPGFELTDDELNRKFVHNGSRLFSQDQLARASETLFALERLAHVSELMQQLRPA
ncbi:MAG: MmgE/PrpD family protein [Burkholderiales bacterium]|nr:MmgE/PrpD family protein [Burkholderiales bacterium]